MSYEVTCGDIKIPITSTLSTFESTYLGDTISVPTIRRDYFNGISYVPSKDIDVGINRGNTSKIQ